MMKVTKTTHGMLMQGRQEENKKVVLIQGMNKNGKWGKPFEVKMLGGEKTASEVIARYTKNNNREYRLAE